MTQQLNYVIFNTDGGWVGILGSNQGLRHTTLPQSSEQQVRQLLGDSLDQAECSPHLFTGLMERFRAYFAGHRIDFPDELDLSGATPFQCRVWEVTRLIPYGDTRSYLWVAEQIKQPGAVRAVGQALGGNRLPIIIPCHRVLAKSGGLGGFGGGLEMKSYLLSLEASASKG